MRLSRSSLALPLVLALLLAACAPSVTPASPSPKPTAPPAPTAAPANPKPAATAAPPATTVAAPATAETAPTQVAQSGAGKELIVFAAASLTDVFGEMATAFTVENGAKVTYNFGGSNQLRTQLEQGAPADVFASANQAEMTNAVGSGVIRGDPRVFAKNRLVVIVPKDNPGKVERLQDLAKPGLKLVLAAPAVPVGGYALQLLDKLAADPTYGADFKSTVLKNLVSQETNVRQVVSKVQLGEADAGVVYSTDVTPATASSVHLIDVPDQYNIVATYPIAVAKSSKDPTLAQRYVDFVLSDAGQAILKKYGFGLP